MEYTLKIYETRSGSQPLTKWMQGLKDHKVRTSIRTRLYRMQLGNFGHCRSLGQGVYEMKIDFGPGYRIYYGMIGHTIVLLLCGGSKKTQEKDIRLASEFFKDHKQRGKEDG
jgi:putative addiction module killer protein